MMVRRWGINVVGEKKVQLASECYGGIVFTTSNSTDPVKKAAFKITASPDGGAITLGVANPNAYKDRNY
jgi:hypothetical protein